MFSFYNMYRSVLISAVLGWGLLSHSPVAEASDGIIRSCSGCTSLQIRQMVKSGPLGYVYVIDYENVELSLWRNTNGGEAGGLNWVEKLTVDPVVEERFLYMMDAKLQAQAAAESSVVEIGRASCRERVCQYV